MITNDKPQRAIQAQDVAHQATADRVNSRIGPDGRVILEPDIFVGRASHYGDGTIGAGQSTVVVTHGAPYTPHASQIHITPTSRTDGFFVDTITSTQFTVHRAGTTGSYTFGWEVNPI